MLCARAPGGDWAQPVLRIACIVRPQLSPVRAPSFRGNATTKAPLGNRTHAPLVTPGRLTVPENAERRSGRCGNRSTRYRAVGRPWFERVPVRVCSFPLNASVNARSPQRRRCVRRRGAGSCIIRSVPTVYRIPSTSKAHGRGQVACPWGQARCTVTPYSDVNSWGIRFGSRRSAHEGNRRYLCR